MKQLDRCRRLALLGVLVLLSAAPASDPFDLVRQGNAAFAQKDFAEARERYERAEGRITDPGLAAFNKGAALYQLAHYREAELQYQYCLADATGPRRTRALFGLGNCLLQQRDRGAEGLSEAIRAYGQCLQHDPDAALAADARYNLELAKLLLARLPPPGKPKQPETGSGKRNEERRPKPEQQPRPGLKPKGTEKPDPRQPGTVVKSEPGEEPFRTDERPPPGAGTTPPLPDKGEVTPLAGPDAEKYLDDAVSRIARERRAYRYRLPRGPGGAVLDW